MISGFKDVRLTRKLIAAALIGIAALWASAANAQQCISSSQTNTHSGFYYSFWTDGGAQ